MKENQGKSRRHTGSIKEIWRKYEGIMKESQGKSGKYKGNIGNIMERWREHEGNIKEDRGNMKEV